MRRNPIIIIVVFLVILGVSGVYLFLQKQVNEPAVITPTPPANVSQTPSEISPTQIPEDVNIIVTSPKPGDGVSLPMIITGQARVFENQLNYRIKDEKGNVLSQGNTYANAPDAGEYGPFTITIKDLGEFMMGKITIEVFDYSAKDGSRVDKVTVPVTLQ